MEQVGAQRRSRQMQCICSGRARGKEEKVKEAEGAEEAKKAKGAKAGEEAIK